MKDLFQLAGTLKEQLGLTPYESRAYLSLLIYGPMSPSEIAQKAGIPRPRAYDVLQNLVEKGLLAEQSGKPSIYASIEPAHGLRSLLIEIEIESSRQLEEKRKTVQKLTRLLSQTYEKSKRLKLEKGKVWFTRRDSAFIALYSEAIRNCEKEVLVASTSPHAPEKEIRQAVVDAVRSGKSVRVVRQATDQWTLEDVQNYEKYIEAGTQVKYLNIKEIPLRFMVFDKRDVILVFPPESALPNLEALWLRIPTLAKILATTFEELWKKGTPMIPVLREIMEKKTQSKRS